MAHFTYSESTDSVDLLQGDVIRRTEYLESVLQEIHPHYLKSTNYTHFLILSQSCDLVRRGGKACSSPYITLAAVRPLREVLNKEFPISHEFDRKYGFAKEATKQTVKSFLQQLYNNNSKEYFFLYRQNDRGINNNSCAFLRLSIALRAQDHYEGLLEGRVISLTQSFRAKLGWLVGTIYGRVATDDFADRNPDSFKSEIESYVDGQFEYLPSPQLVRARKELADEAFAALEEASAAVRAIKVDSSADKALKEIRQIGKVMNVEFPDKFFERLERTPHFQKLSKDFT